MDVIRVLLQRGARLDAKNKDGELPIHIAARSNKAEAFSVLKDANPALMDAVDNNGLTPIESARKFDAQAVLSALGL